MGDVYIPRNHSTQDSKGYAFVRFLKQEDADDALDKMQGYMMNGRELRIEVAQRRRPDNPREHYRGRDEPRRGGGYDRDRYDDRRDRYDDRRDRYDDRRDRYDDHRDRYDDRRDRVWLATPLNTIKLCLDDIRQLSFSKQDRYDDRDRDRYVRTAIFAD